jgi:hypothetical protein
MRTRINKPALLLSLLALAALGLVACGEGDDEDSAPEAQVSPDTTVTVSPDPTPWPPKSSLEQKRGFRNVDHAIERTADNKSCGRYGRFWFAVVEGDVPCRVARGAMLVYGNERPEGAWKCLGGDTGGVCVHEAGVTIAADPRKKAIRRWRAGEATAGLSG